MKHHRHNMATPARLHMLRFAAALVLCCIAAVATADTRLTYDGTNGKYIISIRPGVVRIDGNGPRWQLYVRRSNTLLTVLPRQHSYSRMDTAVATALRDKMATLHDKIEQQLAQLPTDQRQAARAALAEQLPGFADQPQQLSVQVSGNTAFVAGIQCRIVRIMHGDKSGGQACIARADALQLSNAEHATLADMFRLMQAARAGTAYATMGLPYSQLQGIPIRLRSAHTGSERSLADISHTLLADDLFVIPSSFNERTPKHSD